MTSPNLGPLAMFTGTFGGPTNSSGLNMVFRPQSAATPTLPGGSNNVLEINPVKEVLLFLSQEGVTGVPVNRGSQQGDVTEVPILYVHYVEDASIPETLSNLNVGKGVIHIEAGMWLLTPATTAPPLPATVARLGTLPHGVAFNMQGFAETIAGPPTIPPMNCSDSATPSGMQPFVTGTNPPQLLPASALLAGNTTAARLPQSLSSPLAGITVDQGVLNDPNTLLRNAIKGQNIVSTTIVTVDTDHPTIPGGGVTNTAFLLSNATCVRARSTFYLETVSFFGFKYPQIQYTQEVLLDFDGTTFPHCTVATLTTDPLPPVVIP